MSKGRIFGVAALVTVAAVVSVAAVAVWGLLELDRYLAADAGSTGAVWVVHTQQTSMSWHAPGQLP